MSSSTEFNNSSASSSLHSLSGLPITLEKLERSAIFFSKISFDTCSIFNSFIFESISFSKSADASSPLFSKDILNFGNISRKINKSEPFFNNSLDELFEFSPNFKESTFSSSIFKTFFTISCFVFISEPSIFSTVASCCSATGFSTPSSKEAPSAMVGSTFPNFARSICSLIVLY